jgi:predicted  nucleic acid-binding Zn-ribbon protein
LADEVATAVLTQLFALQALDAETARIDGALAVFAETRTANAERKRVAESALEASRQRLEEAELEHRRIEATLGDADALALRLEGQSADVSSNQAYTALLHEIERAKEASSTAEDAILELLDSIDEQRGRTEAESAALAALESEIAAAEEQMQKDEGTFSSKRAAAVAERAAQGAGVEKDLLRNYEIAAGKYVDCVSFLTKRMCAGCRIAIPAQQVQQIRSSGVPAPCPQCKRLVVGDTLYEQVSSGLPARSEPNV